MSEFDPFSTPEDADAPDDSERELAALRSFASRVPQGTSAPSFETRPTDLWSRISAQALTDSSAPSESSEPTAPVTELSRERVARRSRPWARRWELAAAAIVMVIAIAVVAVIGLTSPNSTVVASVVLDTLAGSGTGSAELRDASGSMQLRLNTVDLDPEDGFLEVWVIDPTMSMMVSLGPARPDGIYDIPDNIDMAQFPIVDVSVEPPDGNPLHSGNSVLRGQLEL